MAAQVVSGIGFLGAGTIIFQKNAVRGLTTAAGLWVTAAIGLACGTGMYVVAIIVTVMVLFGLEVMNSFIPTFGTTTVQLTFTASTKESVKRVVDRIRMTASNFTLTNCVNGILPTVRFMKQIWK